MAFLALATMAISSFSFSAHAQESNKKTVECRIYDSSTKEPIKAKITYESLPYGSKIGVAINSSISFQMEPEETYSILVEAKNYIPATERISKEDFEASGDKIMKEIHLVPSGVGRIIRLETLIFPRGESTISEDAHNELDKLASMLKGHPDMIIQLEGHTDFRGNAKKNLKLSQKRVDATKSYLAARGIPKSRIKTKAFGGTKPISRSSDPDSHRLNRRVEVRILQN